MTVNPFDKLNNLDYEYKLMAIPYEQYFGEMELEEDEKKERIELAEKFQVVLLFFFLLYAEDANKDYTKMISDRYQRISKEFLGSKETPEYIKESAEKFAKSITETTIKHDGEKWYTSNDRSMVISENEANNIGNFRERVYAVKNGMNAKRWITMKDNAVRHTHREADEQVTDIFEPFKVGDSLLMFPKDTSLDADMEEIAGCRCVCQYFKRIR